MKYLKIADPLPSILRLGVSYERPTVLDQSILLALEGDLYMAESLKSLRAGLEYHFENIFNLRLGYKALEDNKGPAMGIGVHYEGFSLDLGMSLANEIFNTSQVSVSYKFAGWNLGERKKKQYRDPEEKQPTPKQTAKPEKKGPAKPRLRQEPEQKKDSEFYWMY
jgi:hypothetical protein